LKALPFYLSISIFFSISIFLHSYAFPMGHQLFDTVQYRIKNLINSMPRWFVAVIAAKSKHSKH